MRPVPECRSLPDSPVHPDPRGPGDPGNGSPGVSLSSGLSEPDLPKGIRLFLCGAPGGIQNDQGEGTAEEYDSPLRGDGWLPECQSLLPTVSKAIWSVTPDLPRSAGG